MRIIILLFLSIYTFAVELQKPKVYNGDENIVGWLMSEKLDGIRGYWNGKELQTRRGKKIYSPKLLNSMNIE